MKQEDKIGAVGAVAVFVAVMLPIYVDHPVAYIPLTVIGLAAIVVSAGYSYGKYLKWTGQHPDINDD